MASQIIRWRPGDMLVSLAVSKDPRHIARKLKLK